MPPRRSDYRRSVRAHEASEARAADELARRRVRAVGRCPACTRRVERHEQWLRIGEDPWHVACADAGELDTTPPERSRVHGGL